MKICDFQISHSTKKNVNVNVYKTNIHIGAID